MFFINSIIKKAGNFEDIIKQKNHNFERVKLTYTDKNEDINKLYILIIIIYKYLNYFLKS